MLFGSSSKALLLHSRASSCLFNPLRAHALLVNAQALFGSSSKALLLHSRASSYFFNPLRAHALLFRLSELLGSSSKALLLHSRASSYFFINAYDIPLPASLITRIRIRLESSYPFESCKEWIFLLHKPT